MLLAMKTVMSQTKVMEKIKINLHLFPVTFYPKNCALPNRRYLTTNQRRVTTRKSGDLIYTAAET